MTSTATATHPATIELGPVTLDQPVGFRSSAQRVELVTSLLVDIDHPYDPAGTLYRITSVSVYSTGTVQLAYLRQRKSGGDFTRGGFAGTTLDKLALLDPAAYAVLREALVAAGLVPARTDPTVRGYAAPALVPVGELRRGALVLWNSRLCKVASTERPRGGARRVRLVVVPTEHLAGQPREIDWHLAVDHDLITYRRVTLAVR